MALLLAEKIRLARGLCRLIFTDFKATATINQTDMIQAVGQADDYIDTNIAAMGSAITPNLTANQKRGVFAAVLLWQISEDVARRLVTKG